LTASPTGAPDATTREEGRSGRAGTSPGTELRVVVGCAAVAAAVRLVWVLAVPTRPVGDFAMYWEAADHLVQHGSLDPEFIYMPGYVLALAAVRLLGGGLLAAKLLGVASGALAAGAAAGLAARLFDRAAAVVAGLLCALWPAGVAVASVTGTDMPAGALLVTAAWLLVRDARERPWRAAISFGLVLGLAAWVRAVAMPLALLAAPVWLALRVRWVDVGRRTAVSCVIAFLVLLPWGIRNKSRYGEFFLTDSHGGHTALVGANPDTDGVYSRSLNRMFHAGTGYRLFAEPHRDADRAAYALARAWAAFEPSYALGLLPAKADRLLTHERSLLYWPLYRQGVLPAAEATAGWFARHRTGVERLADAFWYVLVGAALFGLAVAISRRNFFALALAPLPLALSAIYVLFFAEVRYHLAIAVFLFPYAGLGWRWVGQGTRDLVGRRLNARGRRRIVREAIVGSLVVAALFVAWPRVVAAGAQLRDGHRWAVSVCRVEGRDRLCSWRATIPAPGEGVSGVRGVWNGMGLKLSTALAAAATDVALPPGRYRVSLVADTVRPAPAPEVRLDLQVNARAIASVGLPLAAGRSPAPLEGVVEHQGGTLRVEVHAERIWITPIFFDLPTLWVSDLKIEAQLH
jgi:4-amino-4-deoxy-L-arabinose transferase-like glycosyltransferase